MVFAPFIQILLAPGTYYRQVFQKPSIVFCLVRLLFCRNLFKNNQKMLIRSNFVENYSELNLYDSLLTTFKISASSSSSFKLLTSNMETNNKSTKLWSICELLIAFGLLLKYKRRSTIAFFNWKYFPLISYMRSEFGYN